MSELAPRRRGAMVVAAVAVAGLWVAVHAAPAGAVQDATCTGTGNIGMGDARTAQTFTALNTGALTSFQAVLTGAPGGATGTWTVQINTVTGGGVPTNMTLAQTTVPVAQVITPTQVSGTFPTPAMVAAGTGYALVIIPSATTLAPVADNTNPCPGQVYGDNSLTGTWPFSYGGNDLLFATFVDPQPPQQPEPEPQAGDVNAPITAISGGPKSKTRNREATFIFGATDTRAVASFQCSLDGGAFAACTSPHKVRVKKGKHTFQARAIDDAGNVGSPASYSWKRKKRKKKRR